MKLAHWIVVLLVSLVACTEDPAYSVVNEDDPTVETPEDTETPDSPASKDPLAGMKLMQYSRGVVEKMIAQIKSGDEKLGGMALMSLPSHPGHFKDHPELMDELVVPALIEATKPGGKPVFRGVAVGKLAQMAGASKKVMPALLTALDDDELRQHLCHGVGKINADVTPIVEKLASLLSRGSDRARREAAVGLGSCGSASKSAIPALIKALGDDNRTVRRDVAHALGRIGPDARPAIDALRAAAKDKWGPARFAAESAIKKIGG
ncbi:MAG: hypothetical protein CMJ83_22390 [Planctomycetes bacterium]|nr:hypothetical protein [Planctomycetota bacterium]